MVIELAHFTVNGTLYNITPPLPLEINKIEDYYHASNDELEVYGYGNTEEEAIDSAREIFGERYRLAKDLIGRVMET
jgi:hypothetical protein